MRHFLLLFVYIFILASAIYAQETTLTAELRPRAEYRNGYRGLTPDGKALGLISQRSGLNFSYKEDKLEVGIGIRDVRIWGQSGTLELNSGTTAINEAWAEIHMNNVWSVKVGRQALMYSDGRILATNNWNQLGRFHDAVVFKIENDSLFTLHFGGAYNHTQAIIPEQLDYYTVNNYKAMFFVYLKKEIDAAKFELVYLANGMQGAVDSTIENYNNTHFSHTGGIRVSKTKGKFKPEASFYYQGGVNQDGRDVRAFMGTVSATYKINSKWGLQLGSDYISGQDYNENTSVDHRFDLLYGFRHKYYGHQDYFFIGGNTNYGLGFSDTYLKVDYTTENKWNLYATVHQFLSGNDIVINGENQSKVLATEIDLGFSYPISNNVKVMGGYSQILATKTLGALEQADYQRNNNWLWLQLNITPTLFTWKKETAAGM